MRITPGLAIALFTLAFVMSLVIACYEWLVGR